MRASFVPIPDLARAGGVPEDRGAAFGSCSPARRDRIIHSSGTFELKHKTQGVVWSMRH